tara:strand:+ start:57 stop:1367 length:1311 start_codon:yes stop_codon:yes gene_type:complete
MTTFIIRDYPDLDHIFPIMHTFLKKNEFINILNFEINLDLSSDPRIIFLNTNFQNNIKIYEVYNIKGKRFLIDKLINFLSSQKYKKINFKNLKNIKKEMNLFNFIFSIIISFGKKIVFKSNAFYSNFLFGDKWAQNIFSSLRISSLVIDDSYYFNYHRPQSLIGIIKKKKIKITLVPHTCYMFSSHEDLENLKSKKLDNFYANIVVTSEKMKNIFNTCGINLLKIKNLGSARFSKENLDCLKLIYDENTEPKIDRHINKKIKVLYIDGSYDSNYEKNEMIKKISELNFINLVVKAHPRGIFMSKKSNSKRKNVENTDSLNFKVDTLTPTKQLIDNSDIIIGTYSSILVEAMLSYKLIILPKYFLKDKIDFKIFYENFGFAKICQNLNQVIFFLNEFQKKPQEEVNKEKINKFVKEYVYGGEIDSSNTMDKYFDLIK